MSGGGIGVGCPPLKWEHYCSLGPDWIKRTKGWSTIAQAGPGLDKTDKGGGALLHRVGSDWIKKTKGVEHPLS